jgi:UDP-glucose 4-epimerase
LAARLTLDQGFPILNIGTGLETSVNELARRLGELSGTRPPIAHAPARPGEQRRSALDSALATRVLGWQPVTDVGAGLAQTLAWFREAGRPR